MLSLSLFGTPRLTLHGAPLDVPRRKSRALLAYLGAHSGTVPRERLLAIFWPDLDRAAAQQVLRTTIHGLRKLLGPALVSNDDGLALDSATSVDVRQFQREVSSSDPQTLSVALALYQGDFLAGFDLPDGDAFNAWADTQRSHYRQLALRGLLQLAQAHTAQHRYELAGETLERALALDPLHEELHRERMRVQYLAGDRVGAIRRFEGLRNLLDEELGVPPMPATLALYDAIITDSPLPANGNGSVASAETVAIELPTANWKLPTESLPFIGRAAELARLRSAAAPQRLVLIEGEPGIGKTRLALEYLNNFNGVRLVGVAREMEQSLPYQPIIEALRGLLRGDQLHGASTALPPLPSVWQSELARLLPELSADGRGDGTSRPPDEARLWEGVYQLLLTLARQRPLVLLLDDLHWADGSTLALLGYLVRQSQPAPIYFLATSRLVPPRTPLSTLLQTLSRTGRLSRMELGRLAADDVASLAHQLQPERNGSLAAWLVQQSEGNPFILAEVVRELRERSMLTPLHRAEELPAAPLLPSNVSSLIQSRLERLSAPARHMLDTAVALGREFELAVLARAVSLPESTMLDGLDELRMAGLIRPVGQLRYAFDHTLTMEVAYREVGEARHQLLHRQVAEALELLHQADLDEAAGLIAFHFEEGGAPERAAPYAFQAGERAARLAAWNEAIRFYRQALTVAAPTEQMPIHMALGQVYLRNGDAALAAESFRTALALAPAAAPQATEDARLALGEALILQARYSDVIGLAQQMRTTLSHAAAAEFLWGTALSLEGADLSGATDHLRQAELLHLQQEPPNRVGLARVRFELGSVAAQQGQLGYAVARYREALTTIAGLLDATTLHWQILIRNNLAYHLHLLHDPSARRFAEEGLQLAEEQGVLNVQTYLQSTLGEIALAAGDLTGAERHFNQGLALAERLQVPERVAGITANLGLLALQRGEITLAVHRMSTALARADALGTRHLAAQIRIWLAPLLPVTERQTLLAEARALAEQGQRTRLLAEIERLENAEG
ncbi:MAG: AAA family ATPase [Chloroflexaceae bacterium]|jgi:DNA-binding SARP family transcriptional activator|nr:AAA family ATPase [Chloroflexaceae bacterium]